MSQVKQIRKRMYDARNSKLRIKLMYLVRGLQWQAREKASATTETDPFDLTWD